MDAGVGDDAGVMVEDGDVRDCCPRTQEDCRLLIAFWESSTSSLLPSCS